MDIHVLPNYEMLSAKAARIVADRVKQNRTLVLGMATGGTPLLMYRELIAMRRRGEIDFDGVTTFNLDEYYPISADNPQSYYFFMRTNFWDPAGIDPRKRHIPDGATADVAEECRRYEAAIEQAGGIDLQILGIGENGHIGFNEPGESLEARTHLTRLDETTIAANSRFFNRPEDVPRSAITMGMGTIMKSREILLLASGERKAAIIEKALTGGISTSVPASLLQLHPRVTVLLDKEAGRCLADNPAGR